MPGVGDKLRTFYVAPEDREPLGRTQHDDAMARSFAETWRDAGREIGAYTYVELGGMPLGGQAAQVLDAVLAESPRRRHRIAWQCSSCARRSAATFVRDSIS